MRVTLTITLDYEGFDSPREMLDHVYDCAHSALRAGSFDDGQDGLEDWQISVETDGTTEARDESFIPRRCIPDSSALPQE